MFYELQGILGTSVVESPMMLSRAGLHSLSYRVGTHTHTNSPLLNYRKTLSRILRSSLSPLEHFPLEPAALKQRRHLILRLVEESKYESYFSGNMTPIQNPKCSPFLSYSIVILKSSRHISTTSSTVNLTKFKPKHSHLFGHGLEWKSPENDGLVHAIKPSPRRDFLHHHIVSQCGVK